MHTPLIMLIALTLVHIPKYRGPLVLWGSQAATQLEDKLEAGFKDLKVNVCWKFYDLEGGLPCSWNSPEKWSWALLFKFT